MNEGAVYLAGFGGRGGFGRRPALIVVDMTLGFTDPESPLGSNLNNLIDAIRKLLGAARPGEIPVSTTVAYRESEKLTAAAFIDKVPAVLALGTGSRWAEIDPSIAPRKAEPVSNKVFASGLFGTGLSSALTAADVDTLIVTAANTSGCVWATAMDALNYGFRPIVPREAVGDRNPETHEASGLINWMRERLVEREGYWQTASDPAKKRS